VCGFQPLRKIFADDRRNEHTTHIGGDAAHQKAPTMTITEADRNDMRNEFVRCHGNRLGDIIMEHLPPVSWRDVARQQDIARLEQRIDTSDLARQQDIARLEQRIDTLDQTHRRDIARLENRMDLLEQRMDKRFDGVIHAMWAMGGLTATGFFGLFTMIVVKF
jgi:hypothetical protein